MVDKILVLDVETTGLNERKEDQILQLSAVYYEYGKEVSVFDKHVLLEADYKNVSLGALKVTKTKFTDILPNNNIGGEYIGNTSRTTERKLVYDFCDWLLQQNLDRNVLVVGQNVSFDLNFVKQLFTKYNITGYDGILPYRVYDTMTVNHLLSRSGIIGDATKAYSGGTLEKIASKLGIDIGTSNLHDSLVDCRLTAQIVFVAEAKLRQMKEVFDLYIKNNK